MSRQPYEVKATVEVEGVIWATDEDDLVVALAVLKIESYLELVRSLGLDKE